jgi:hypothetical protein
MLPVGNFYLCSSTIKLYSQRFLTRLVVQLCAWSWRLFGTLFPFREGFFLLSLLQVALDGSAKMGVVSGDNRRSFHF